MTSLLQTGSGMISTYAGRRRPRSNFLSIAAVLLMCATGALADNLLLDNFNGAGNPTPTDINYNLAARQTGSSLGTVTWTVAGANAQLGHAVMPNGLRVAGDGSSTSGWASPDHSFSGAECAGGLVIEFDIDPQRGSNPSTWLALNFGMTAADRWTSVNVATPHLSLLFYYGVGASTIFDGATLVANFANGVPSGTLTHVRLELTDSTDGNPLDGVGQTTVAVYTTNSPTPVYTYTKAGGGLAGGYITFQASPADIGLLDNLNIAHLVIPAPTVSIATYAGVSVTGIVGRTYGIQATATLENAESWVGVGNVTLTSTTQIWYDSLSTAQQPRRLYRVIAGAVSVP